MRKRYIHPEFGTSVGGLIDYTPGDGKHVKDVESYLSGALPRWIQESPFRDQVRHSVGRRCNSRLEPVRTICILFVSFSFSRTR